MGMSPGPKLGWSLVCLTSTRHRRFVEDIIALNALPVGAHWRFRYLLKYVDPAVIVLADDPAGIGIQLLLGISSFDDEPLPRNATADYGRHLDALRRGKSLSIRKTGELLVIDFEVGPFLEAFDLADLAPPEVQRCLPERAGTEAPQGWFCTIVPASKTPEDSELLGGWERAAETTLSRTSADLVPFVFGVLPSADPKARPKMRNGQLTLQAGRRTEFEVHTLARKAGSSSPYKRATGEIKLGLSHPSFSFTTSSTMRIDTHRNAKTLAFQSAPAFKETVGHLSVLAFSFGDPAKPAPSEETSTDREGKRPALVRIDLALSTGKSRTWLFCSLAGIVLALTSTSFDNGLPASLEMLRIGVIVVLSVFGLRQGLTLKG